MNRQCEKCESDAGIIVTTKYGKICLTCLKDEHIEELEKQLKNQNEKIEKLTKCVEDITLHLHVSVDQIELARQTLKEIKEQGGVKRNCINCKHLGYIDDQSFEMQDGGLFCEKREYRSEKHEADHLNLLNYEDQRYLKTYKSCCELKEQGE